MFIIYLLVLKVGFVVLVWFSWGFVYEEMGMIVYCKV